VEGKESLTITRRLSIWWCDY